MKTLFSLILLVALSTSLFAEKNYSFDIYNINAYNSSIPALSLAITPKNKSGFKFILSYVSTLFNFGKTTPEYALSDKYDNISMSLNFRF